LTTCLAASAKVFQPGLYPQLHQHSEALLAKAFISGEKSIETVQAVIMLTYWKEPDDTRVWQLVGYACRMCVELRVRRMKPSNLESVPAVMSETETRERRNLERTWLTIFVYDRRQVATLTFRCVFLTCSFHSVSLQLGKQWMLHVDDITRSAGIWYQHELAIPNSDAILSAFVQLRLLTSDLLDVVDNDLSPSNQQQYEVLLRIFNTDLDDWEKKWNAIFEKRRCSPPLNALPSQQRRIGS
jgi:hypothetical protein